MLVCSWCNVAEFSTVPLISVALLYNRMSSPSRTAYYVSQELSDIAMAIDFKILPHRLQFSSIRMDQI